MRCEIAASLIHSPRTLLLDEPTIGLDAVSKIAVRQFIKELNQKSGTTVLLTTHDMQDIEALTERVLLIGKGRILLDGSLETLKSRAAKTKTLAVRFTGNAPAPCRGLEIKEQSEGRCVLTLDPLVLSVSDAIAYLASQTELTDVSVTDISAESMVAALYREYEL